MCSCTHPTMNNEFISSESHYTRARTTKINCLSFGWFTGSFWFDYHLIVWKQKISYIILFTLFWNMIGAIKICRTGFYSQALKILSSMKIWTIDHLFAGAQRSSGGQHLSNKATLLYTYLLFFSKKLLKITSTGSFLVFWQFYYWKFLILVS